MNDSSSAVITVGATLSHGGVVKEGSPTVTDGGRNVSYEGCSALCYMHGLTTIVHASGTAKINGKPIAVTGDKTACGAVLTAFVEPSFGENNRLQQQRKIMNKYINDGGDRKYLGTKVTYKADSGNQIYTFSIVDGHFAFVSDGGNAFLPSTISPNDETNFFGLMGQMVGVPYDPSVVFKV